MGSTPDEQISLQSIPSVVERSRGTEYRISSFRTVNVPSITETKSHVAAGFPVVIGMEVYDNLGAYRPGETYAAIAGNLRGGHAVVVIGYDDSRGGIGGFLILNCWGDEWERKDTSGCLIHCFGRSCEKLM
jgi:hypothetical protein